MTYRQLLLLLQQLNPEQLDMNVTAYLVDTDEFMPVQALQVAVENQILDDEHPYLEVI